VSMIRLSCTLIHDRASSICGSTPAKLIAVNGRNSEGSAFGFGKHNLPSLATLKDAVSCI
jgi:hypothetical protein